MAKKKLEAACYGYGRDWARLFHALDGDDNGSLDAEEFRVGEFSHLHMLELLRSHQSKLDRGSRFAKDCACTAEPDE